LSHKLEVGERLSLVSHCTFTTDSPPGWHPCYIVCRTSPRQKCVDIAILLPRIIRFTPADNPQPQMMFLSTSADHPHPQPSVHTLGISA